MLFEGALAGPAAGQSGGGDDAADDLSVPASWQSDHSERRGRWDRDRVSPLLSTEISTRVSNGRRLAVRERAQARMVPYAGEGTRTLTPPEETLDFKAGAKRDARVASRHSGHFASLRERTRRVRCPPLSTALRLAA